MRRNKAWHKSVSGDLFWVGIAVLAAGVLFLMFFRAASLIDPRRADGYDEMTVFLASHSFLLIPCAVFVLLGINAAIVGGIRLFRQGAPPGGLSGAWRKRTEAARVRWQRQAPSQWANTHQPRQVYHTTDLADGRPRSGAQTKAGERFIGPFHPGSCPAAG